MTEGRLGKSIGKSFSKKEDTTQVQELQEQLQEAQRQISIFQDRENLKDEGYFRQMALIQLERMAIAQEEQVSALKNLAETPSDEEIEEEQ